jgi:hypothetical protein
VEAMAVGNAWRRWRESINQGKAMPEDMAFPCD